MNIEIIIGDISKITADALVNAANNHLWMGSGVAGALKRRGGQIIEDQAMDLGPVEVGSAVVTTAGSLPATYVIHGAVMGQDLRTDEGKITKTTISCLEKAIELKVRSIAFPAFGCGVGGMAYGKCARSMLEAFNSMSSIVDDMKVMVVLHDRSGFDIFLDLFGDNLR